MKRPPLPIELERLGAFGVGRVRPAGWPTPARSRTNIVLCNGAVACLGPLLKLDMNPKTVRLSLS